MTSAPDSRRPETVDSEAQLRQLHAQAVERVPGRTLLQLRLRASQAPAGAAPRGRPRTPAWPLAATCALALVVGGVAVRQGLDDRRAPAMSPAPPAVADESEPALIYAALDESPELYLWLASTDNAPLAVE